MTTPLTRNPTLRQWTLWAAAALLLLIPGAATAQLRINYQDAELTTVISALAEMAGLNVVFVGVEPTTRVTLKMGRPIPAEDIPGLLRTILESAGFVAVERNGLLQVVPAGHTPTIGETQVFVHPLRHATAEEIASTLAAIYGGTDAAAAASGGSRNRRSLSQQNRAGGMINVPPAIGGMGGVQGGGLGFPGGSGMAGGARAQLEGGQGGGAIGGVMVGEAVVVPYTPTNSLIVRTTPRHYEQLRETIDRLDTRPEQVLIEVFVAEVTLDRRSQFGVDWTATLAAGGRWDPVRTAERFPTFADTTPGGLVVRMLSAGGNVDVRATLRALAEDSRVNVLATPSILARNNEEARILVGSQVPFTQIARSGLSGEVLDRVIQFRDVGTELAIIPTINQGGYITLEVLQQVSTLTNQTLFGAPVITVREAQTSAVVRDRQTIILGGLIGTEEERVRRGIPILKDIPLLGYLFRDTQRAGRKTELAIFLTPYLVRSDEEVERLRERSIDRLDSGRRIERQLQRQRLDDARPDSVRPDSLRPNPVRPDTLPGAPPQGRAPSR